MGRNFRTFCSKMAQKWAILAQFEAKLGAEMLHFEPQNVGHRLHFEGAPFIKKGRFLTLFFREGGWF